MLADRKFNLSFLEASGCTGSSIRLHLDVATHKIGNRTLRQMPTNTPLIYWKHVTVIDYFCKINLIEYLRY